MSFTLKQLRYAIAVADLGHFGRAAAACNVTQPALSQQIQSLEAWCGIPIFDRLVREVRLTPFGREFVGRARPLLSGAEALASFAAGPATAPDRPLRFGLIPTVAPYLLPDVFPALAQRLPEMRFAISEDRTGALLAALGDGSLDLALIGSELPRGGPKLSSLPLFEDPFVLATSLAEAREGPVSLAGVPPERILLLDEGHCFRDQAIAACDLGSELSSRTFAATSLSTIVEFVAAGQGVTLLPRIALRKEAGDRIAIHPLAPPRPGRHLSLVWRDGSPFAGVFEQVAELIRETGMGEAKG
ncbi:MULTISPECIES: hydrogen peroxide-inducible genes activator [unclassified Devosia]|uniref:hydrogen peroxide-inducible genes activator n=1 Tax=unclassified Devosia TaxID=196773 RepID=UPI0015567224|nr:MULTISPECIES: hydrogen peroxide-inducible genes activator [unclassified Devosia]